MKANKDDLVTNNLRLVHHVAHKLRAKAHANHVDYEDMYGAGCVGLVKAANSFDPNREVKFSSYAVPIIHGEICHYIRDNGRALQLPRSEYELGGKIRWANMEGCSVEEIAQHFECKPSLVKRTLESMRLEVLSTDRTVHDGEDERVFGDFIGGSDDYSSIYVNEFIQSLTDREKTIVCYRLNERSQREAGQACGVGQVQVSRQLKCIQKKLIAAI